MKSFLTIFLFTFFLFGNAQSPKNFEHFQIKKDNMYDSLSIRLTPLSFIDLDSTARVGVAYLINKTEYSNKLIDLVKQTFTCVAIPSEIKKGAFMDVYFDKEKKIIKISFSMNERLLNYTTEQQWLDFEEGVKTIDLEPYIDIPNKESFDFGVFHFKIFGI